MPVVPQPDANGIVRQMGFAFNFSNAFASTATTQGFTTNSNFTAIQASLGASNDVFPTQSTAWGRANQAYTLAVGGNVPSGSVFGQIPVWDGTAWVRMEESIGIGNNAGEITQSIHTVAIGSDAARYNQGTFGVAVGHQAGFSNQSNHTTALGAEAGRVAQSDNATAVGVFAGKSNQGSYALALGFKAGETSQPANSIILNATSFALDGANTDALYIKPIRANNGNGSLLTYDTVTGEVNSDTAFVASLGSSNDTASLTSSVWAYAKQAEADAQTVSGNLASLLVADNVGGVGLSTDTASLTTSLWAYAKQAELDASGVASALASLTTADTIGAVGTSGDTASLTTSLWAYAKQAEADAQSALGNTAFTNINVTNIYSDDGNSAILMPNSGEGTETMAIGTATNSISIGAGNNLSISCAGNGSPTAITTITTPVLNLEVGNTSGTAGQVLTASGANTCAWASLPGSSMTWDFEGSGLGHTTTLNLASPYTWTTSFQKIWTLAMTIPPDWVGRANTFVSLFIWNCFNTTTNTLQYFTYQISGGGEQPLGKTSSTRPFTNGGQNQLIPIAGNLVGIPLTAGDFLTISLYGKVATGTHTLNNITETGWGVITASY